MQITLNIPVKLSSYASTPLCCGCDASPLSEKIGFRFKLNGNKAVIWKDYEKRKWFLKKKHSLFSKARITELTEEQAGDLLLIHDLLNGYMEKISVSSVSESRELVGLNE